MFLFFIVGLELIEGAGDLKTLPGFQLQTCILSEVQVVELERCVPAEYGYHSKYIALWKDASTGFNVIKNPFATQMTKAEAEDDVTEYQVPSNPMPCMCNNATVALFPNVQTFYSCQIWNACVLDVDMITKMQADGGYHAFVGQVLLYVDAGILALMIFVLVVFCMIHYHSDYRTL